MLWNLILLRFLLYGACIFSGVPVFGGIGSDGRDQIRENSFWTQFADREGLWLVSATFPVPSDVHDRKKCYYYPESGSMDWFLSQVDQLATRENLDHPRLLMVGFSGGAHFVHRFGLWKPSRVSAIVAHSAAWWDEPVATAKTVPMLVMCGEDDDRFDLSMEFYQKASKMGFPMVWRSFPRLGHAVDARVLGLAQVFIKEFIGGKKPPFDWVGETQEWKAYPKKSAEVDRIPPEYRVWLPSEVVARKWEEGREN